MRGDYGVALAVVAVLATVAVSGVVASGAGPAAGAASGDGGNASTDAAVSTFMQASAGETGEAVEAGMWNAAYESADDRARKGAVVEHRTAAAERRLAELRAEKQWLLDARANGTIDDDEFRARMGRVAGRLAVLNRSLAETERQAEATGANPEAVRQLRERARNLSGPEVAAVVRGIAGEGPVDLPPQANGTDRGPPGDARGTDDRSNASENGRPGTPGGDRGGGPDGQRGGSPDGERGQGIVGEASPPTGATAAPARLLR